MSCPSRPSRPSLEQPLDRQIPFPGVVAEGQDSASLLHTVDLLRYRRQGRSGGRAHENPFLLGGPARKGEGFFLSHLNGPVQSLGMQVGGNKAGPNALDLVGTG